MADQPNYTRIPNDIIEAMPTLGNAELRVLLAIARKTVGWQKECDVISARQLASATGLTLRNTHAAIHSLAERGFIERQQAGKQTFCYTLKPLPVGIRSDCIPSDTGTLGDTAPLPVGIQSDEKPYPLGYQQKKDLKERKERDGSRVARTPPPPRQTNLDSFNEAVVIFKELSGKKHITPALATLIVNRVSNLDRWRATIEGWVGCGYNVMGVKDMLDWYDHPEKMSERLARNGSPRTNGYRKDERVAPTVGLTKPVSAPPDAKPPQESAARMLAMRDRKWNDDATS